MGTFTVFSDQRKVRKDKDFCRGGRWVSKFKVCVFNKDRKGAVGGWRWGRSSL